jgi:hypothetical protein
MTDENNIKPAEPAEEKSTFDLDIAYSRLRKIGRDKFQLDSYSNENYLSKVKSSSHFFNLNIPVELHEFFIEMEDAPLFWLLDSPLLVFVEENSKSGEKEGIKGENEPAKLIRDYYSKWVTALRKSEKKYFAQSLLKSISKEKGKTIISNILDGILFSFDENLVNSETAQQHFEQAEILAAQIQTEDKLKIELLYLLKVYSGFDHYKMRRIFESSQKFKEALVIKPEGINAKFYLAITEIMQGEFNTGFDLVCDIYDYDLARISYALTNNNFNLFQYFVKNPVSQYIFRYKDFAPICTQLDEYLQGKELGSSDNLIKIRKKFESFKGLHLGEYQEHNIKTNIAFIEKIIKTYFTSPLNLFLASVELLWIKFNEIMQLVFSTIRQRYVAEIQKQLRVYDQNTKDLNNLIEHLTKEIADLKIKYKEKVRISVEHYELHIKEQTNLLERKLTSLADDKEGNPGSTFKSSLTYTIILSALIMLIVGFASYSSNYSNEINGLGQIVKEIIFIGGKWGVLTFIIGFFISVISTVYAVFEKSQEKQRVIKEIANLKLVKERNIEHIKMEADRNEKITMKHLFDRIETHKKRILEINEERVKHEEKLNREIEEKIKEEAQKLIDLIEKP